MEIDGDLEMVWVAIATSPFLDGGDLRVQAFGNRVGDAMREVGQHIGKVTRNQFGRLQFLEARPGLVRHVLRIGQPQVLALGEGGVARFEQRLVLLLSDLVDGFNDVAHDVEMAKTILASACGTLSRQALM